MYGGGGSSLAFGPAFPRFLAEVAHDDTGFTSLTAGDVSELADVYPRLLKHDNSVVDLQTAIADYFTLREIPKRSSLRLIGLFAILESLLTHDPKPGDPYDSITRQVTKKMALLDHRFECPLPYQEYFEDLKPKNVWGDLYGLRSDVAHGIRLDFKKKFVSLGTIENAFRFVQVATKSAMRRALEEPRLMADLRQC
jgi:hypothetical protein